MSVRITCPSCGKRLKAPESLAGKRSRCPACREIVRFPTLEESDFETSDEPEPEPVRTPSKPRQSKPKSDESFDWNSVDVARESSGTDSLDDDDFSNLPTLPDRPRKPKKSSQQKASWGNDESDEQDSSPKKKSKPRRASRYDDEDDVSNFRQLGIGPWFLLLAFLPLAWTTFFPPMTLAERKEKILEAQPEIQETIEAAETLEEITELFPDNRLPGAHLSRNSLFHWVYASVSTLSFLFIAHQLIPKTRVKSGTIFAFGLFTGTIGILLLLAFQFLASISGLLRLWGRGLIVIFILILRFIAFSYQCAQDESTGFFLSFIGFTCGVGLCEEACKALPIAYYLANTRKTDWKSIVVVGFASGVGFGISEGVMYSGDFYNGLASGITYVVRFVSCVTLHAIWSSAVALLMYNNQDHLPGNGGSETAVEGFFQFILCYLTVSMTLHGLYDTLLKMHIGIGALAVAVASYGWWVWLINRQLEVEADD